MEKVDYGCCSIGSGKEKSRKIQVASLVHSPCSRGRCCCSQVIACASCCEDGEDVRQRHRHVVH